MSFTFSVIFLLGAVQSAILAAGLYSRRDNSAPNRYLITILALFTFNLFKLFIDESGLYRDFSHLIYSDASIALLYGPLFYFYVRALTTGRTFSKKDIVHFIPFIVHFLIIFPALSFDGEVKIRAFENFINHGFTHNYQPLLTYGLKIIQYFSYLAVCIHILRKYRNSIEDHLSTTYRTELKWLSDLFYANAGFLLILFISLILHASRVFTMNHHFTRISYLWDMVLILLLSFMAFRQSAVFQLPKDERSVQQSGIPDEFKYGAARLENETADSILAELLQYMETEKPYLDPELTVTALAEKLSLQRYMVSQVINSRLNMNFYSFVNGYRIESAKKMFSDPSFNDKNIIEIAYLSGFTSKSHFNSSFKKATGLTPKEFRKQKGV